MNAHKHGEEMGCVFCGQIFTYNESMGDRPCCPDCDFDISDDVMHFADDYHTFDKIYDRKLAFEKSLVGLPIKEAISRRMNYAG